jgi:3-methylcrotonyl-CoA carboxylase alpha subunit
MKKLNKILIANRGEIAVRIIRAAREMDIRTVAIYAGNDDMDSLHINMADESYYLPGDSISDTYLNIEKVLEVAGHAKVDAIHPGYGFLAENPSFAEACKKAGIIFIGPEPEVIRLMGNKIEARETIAKLGFPVISGMTGTKKELLVHANDLVYPVIAKAAAGGGGKGMRIIRSAEELEEALDASSREAKNYFGDPAIYLETYIDPARHIEFQVLADHHGNVVHLFERECSIQRRYQKIIEECPSPTVKSRIRKKMGETAVAIAREIKYTNAGTIEFLVDPDQNFYFLEMNTRIQVEHPVTEMALGIDLVQGQLDIAAGNPLEWQQENIKLHGHAIEARIYAEEPLGDFKPSPGQMTFYKEPEYADVRMDAGQDKPVKILPDYDPMISKMIAFGDNRSEAKEKLVDALHDYTIHGVQTNISYLQAILSSKEFEKNRIHTKFCEENSGQLADATRKLKKNIPTLDFKILFVAGSYLYGKPDHELKSPWHRTGYWRSCNELRFIRDGEEDRISFKRKTRDDFYIDLEGRPVSVHIVKNKEGLIELRFQGRVIRGYYSESADGKAFVSINGTITEFHRFDFLPDEDLSDKITRINELNDQFVVSPMHGKIIQIKVKVDDTVRKGDVLFTIDSMKMENTITAPRGAKIKEVIGFSGKQVEINEPVIELD